MSNPLQNRSDARRTAGEKILGIVDVVMKVCEALLRIFGRRKEDKQ